MRKALPILFLLFSINTFATKICGVNIHPVRYRPFWTTIGYVSTTGSDVTGDGSVGNPWASLKKASTQLTTINDIIHVMGGTYTELNQCTFSPGVYVEGEGTSTHIKLGYYNTSFYQAALMFTSGTEGTNGSQTIQNMWLDIQDSCFQAILIRCRSNVICQYLTITGMQVSGIHLAGKLGENTGVAPSTFSDNNQIIHCRITDCNDRVIQALNNVSCGNITYEGQSNFIFDYDTLINIGRAQGHNGDLGGAIQGNNKGGTITHLVQQKPRDEGNEFNCGFESWFDMGGTIYAFNDYLGGGNALDIGYGGSRKYGYAYAWLIHDNYFHQTSQPDSLPTYPKAIGNIAIQFETSTNATYGPFPVFASGDDSIYNNHYKNFGTRMSISLNNNANDTVRRIYSHNELCENMGYANSNYSAIDYYHITNGSLIDSIFDDNFTETSGSPGSTWAGLFLEHSTGNIRDIYYRNTIIEHSNTGYIVFRGSILCDYIFCQNNDTYLNANSNNPKYFSGAPSPTTNFTVSGNITGDPLLDGTFHLTSSSPCIGTGLGGVDIGAFPFTVIPPQQNILIITHGGKIVLTN